MKRRQFLQVAVASAAMRVAGDAASAPTSERESFRNRLPRFCWERVPPYLHFGKTEGPLSNAEIRFVAERCDLICLEKAHGIRALGSTEKGIAHDARRIKAVNPNAKVLFYWNTFLNYPLYDACREITQHPEWIFRDRNGNPIYKTGKLEQYNLLEPAFREWWAGIAGRAVTEYGCDGIFMDAVDQAKRPIWMRQGWGEGKEPQLTEAVIDMMRRARSAMGESALLLYNGLRSTAEDTTGDVYLPFADGAMVEHFGIFGSGEKEALQRDLETIRRAAQGGKIVAVKGWPDPQFVFTNSEKMREPRERLIAEARDKITFSLACFLIAAEPYTYFAYAWGYRADDGCLIDYPELSRPLGPPQGPPDRDGWMYRRRFAHATVEVDLSERRASIDWDG
ncbi:MAG: hypothetical protein Kow0040_30510 [Thermogutta sp.]